MKTKSIFLSFFSLQRVSAALTSCSGHKQESDESHEGHDHAHEAAAADATPAESNPHYEVDATFQKQLARCLYGLC